MTPYRLLAAPLLLLALTPASASAVSLADGKLFISGNGEWSYQATSRAGTAYLRADSDGDWHTAMFDLLTVAKPVEELTLTAQMGFENEGVALEWAFLEWRLSDALRLRAGKVKQPFGNYAELQFTGTARPLFDLATSVYGPANVMAEAYQGIGFTGDLPFGAGWSFQYDVWGGAILLPAFEPFDWFNGELTGTVAAPAVEEERVENVVGLRASVTTPSQWTFRLSGYGGNVEKDEEKRVQFWVGGASAWYRGEQLWLSGEAVLSSEKGYEQTIAGYAEAGWFLTEKVQVAARYEISRTDVDGLKTSDALVRHDGWTAGAGYWITPGAVIKASVDYVKGSRFLRREAWDVEGATVTLPTARPVGETFRFLVGTQFTF